MLGSIQKRDLELLKIIAENRVVTYLQLAHLSGRNLKSIRRRVPQLQEKDFVQLDRRSYAGQQGRPQVLVSIGEASVRHLKNMKISDAASLKQKLMEKLQAPDHQLLLNYFRIHLNHLELKLNGLKTDFMASNSPFIKKDGDGRLWAHEFAPVPGDNDGWLNFIPDGVFTIRDVSTDQEKSLLFFLEVDMGSEALHGAIGKTNHIKHKVQCYQALFRSKLYKRYEKAWECGFNGFRLLFLANTHERLQALSRIISEMKPSDFIWLTEQNLLSRHGLGGNIWMRGGQNHLAMQSIIGPSKSFSYKLPIGH